MKLHLSVLQHKCNFWELRTISTFNQKYLFQIDALLCIDRGGDEDEYEEEMDESLWSRMNEALNQAMGHS